MINPLRKQKIEIDESPVFKPSAEEAVKTWAIEARGGYAKPTKLRHAATMSAEAAGCQKRHPLRIGATVTKRSMGRRYTRT